MNTQKYLLLLIIALSAVFLWSAINPLDRFTWALEVAPVLIGLPVLVCTYPRFPLSRLAYGMLLVHAVILLIGGHYTYAEMPLFNWLRDEYGLSRNYYDRVGHFAQGFVPAIITREILLRCTPLKPGGWLFFLVSCVCLAFSASYEFFEWAVAITTGSDATAFLATQGDIWDTQWDMLLALIGSVLAQVLLAGVHDRALKHRA